MRKMLDSHIPYFRGVALALIVCGAGIVAVGLVEWLMNLFSDGSYTTPLAKVIGGLIVTALGYIHLDLELIRTK